jgi:magnesium-transporting ATPase (P-type)
MKMSKVFFSWLSVMPGLAVVVLPAAALAQDNDNSNALAAAMGGVMLFVVLAVCAAMYIYVALALQTIAKKTNTENAWMAWIPIANIFLALMVAKKPLWWFILFLIPLVNVVMWILVWMGIAEARSKPNWWGIMVIVPVMNVIMPGYLAWSD